MRGWPAAGLGIASLGTAAGGFYLHYRRAMAEAERAWTSIAARTSRDVPVFDPAMVADQPEIARRYFAHAIAPGTPLHLTAELEMRGIFLLGSRDSPRRYAMTARQILRPPHEFVWLPRLTTGSLAITGFDLLAGGRAATRFWMNGLVPVANVCSSPDLVRSAAFRAATEGLWVPASFLPQNGVRWEQVGPDKARLTITRATPPVVLDLTLAADGGVKEIVSLRWSDANPAGRFQLQPFGGTVGGEARFGGFTIPSRLAVGNHYGTPDYLPFFQAEVTGAAYR